MKKISSLILCVLLLLPMISVFAGATDVEVTNASRPAVQLAVTQQAQEGDILIVTVSLAGCEGLTDADLRFTYDPEVLTYLGASLVGAAAGDKDLIASFPSADEASGKGWVAVSFFHMDRFDVYDGNGDFCELAFRARQGRTSIKAEAVSFRIDEENVSPKLGSCRYSSGFASFFRENGSLFFIIAVIAVVAIVLIVLLVMIRKTKKKMPAPALFDDNSAQTPEAEEKTTDPESGDDAQNVSPADEKAQSEDEAPQELPAEEPQQEQNKDEGEQ